MSATNTATRAEFDAQFLDTYTGGDRDARDQVLKLFLVQSHMLLGKLEEAIGAPKAWGDAAHSLKGCAKSVGANTVAELALQAEAESVAAKGVQHQRLVELKTALAATVSQVETLIREV